MTFRAVTLRPLARWTLALALCALTGCGRTPPTGPLTDSDKKALENYEQIRAALAVDDAKAAKRAAAKMVVDLKPADDKAPAPPLLAPANAVAEALAIDTMRQHFEVLSNQVVPMVRGLDGYYVMASDLPNTVPWVQRTKEVDNPFVGKMLHWIGDPVK